MDALDKEQAKLKDDQWGLLRIQVESLTKSLSYMTKEMIEIRELASQEHIESVVQQLLAEFIGDSADKQKELSDTLHNEMSDIRSELAEVMEIASKEQIESSIEQLLSEFIGDSAGKHKALLDQYQNFQSTMEMQFKRVEGLIGEFVDTHKNDLPAPLSNLRDMTRTLNSEKNTSCFEIGFGEPAGVPEILKLGKPMEIDSRQSRRVYHKPDVFDIALDTCSVAGHNCSEKGIDYSVSKRLDSAGNHKETWSSAEKELERFGI